MLLVLLVRDTRVAHCLDGIVFDIVDGKQKFALLAVHVRFLLGRAHQVEDARGLVENAVHFLQRTTSCFGVEEVSHREDECVAVFISMGKYKGGRLVGVENSHDGKNDVRLVSDVLKSNRGNHDNEEVENPVRRGSQGIGRRANLQWHDFGRVQPGHAQPADSEEGVEDKQEHAARNLGLGRIDTAGDREGHHGQRHSCRTEQHQLATTKLLNDKDRDQRGQEVFGSIAGGDQSRHDLVQSDLVLQERGDVVRNQVDTGNLLEHLVDIGKHGAVQMTVLAHGEHVAERPLGHFQDGSLDCDELVLHHCRLRVIIQQGRQYFARIVIAILEHQPPRRLWQEHNKSNDNSRKEDLERQRETPRDGVRVSEEEAEIDPVTDGNSACNHGTFNHDHLTATVGLAALGLPGGHSSCVHSISCPSQYSSCFPCRKFIS